MGRLLCQWEPAFFVDMIIDFFAQTANRSEQIALDTSGIVVAMADGPDDTLKTLKNMERLSQLK